MTTTRDDLLAMAATLRKALGATQAQQEQGQQEQAHREQGGTGPDWRAGWPGLAGLGIAGLCVAEDAGGFGSEVPAALVAARELGAALHPGPYPAMVAASYALSRWLDGEDRARVADAVLSGDHVATLALLDPAAVVATDAGGPRVEGQAHLVAGAGQADSFLVLPRGGDALLFIRRDEALAVTPADDLDVSRQICDVTFTGAHAVPLAAPPGGRALAERLHGLLLAGDALGGLSLMLDKTVAYAAKRTAFGRVIGGYQAVQHRLVDHALALRGMSLLADEAAARFAVGAPGAGRAALLAEASVAAGALPLLHDLVQLTGAIGFTWEYGLHLYERRAHLDARLGRNPRQARRLLAEQAGWLPRPVPDQAARKRTDEGVPDASLL
jgi:alkylation response protein AidB-like acyl-CoA dehydrogenase